MGLFGKGVTWSALRSMGESRGEYQPLLSSNQSNQRNHMMRAQYLNPIMLLHMIAKERKWQKEETQDTKKIKC
uniref:S2 protein n=1 Tax=Equine infectious anemia virus TaxID=11665 RepID=A0A5J6SBR3_9RETR|nr:S2 protein [Equine infectious anemia virus]